MNTNLLFFDIDGTLQSEVTHTIPKSALNALKKAQENGHLVIINTGRPYASISQRLKDINYDGIICGCGTYIELHHKVLFHQSLDQNLCHTIIEKLQKHNMYGLLEGRNAVYYDTNNTHEHINHIKQGYDKENMDTSHTWQEENVIFDKMTVWHDQKSEAIEFNNFASQYFDIIKRSHDFNEYVPLGFSKATGIQFFMDYLNIPHQNTYCFGDSPNDLAMLRFVEHSVAMANSAKEVLDAVEFVTKDVDEDGIEYALKHYNLI